jgi:hypothetical protein
MVIGLTPEEFIDRIGHDGSDEPYEKFPGIKAGFHQQECIEVLQQLGYACTPIEIVPQMMPFPNGPIRSIWFSPEKLTADSEDWNWQRLKRHLYCSSGVFTGIKRKANHEMIGHAVAWNGWEAVIYDSQGPGYTYSINDAHNYGFTPQTFWKVQEIQ